MSTRGTIAIENTDGTITAVYAHYDNYIESTGITLFQNYNTTDKVKELLKNGDIRSLGETLEDTSFFYDDNTSEDFHIYNVEDYDDLPKEEYNYLWLTDDEYPEGRWIWDEDELETTLKEKGLV